MSENERANAIYEYILKNIVIPRVGSNTTFQDKLYQYGKFMLGKKFAGVFASDKIPKLTKSKPYAIVNLDASNMPGSHWVALAFTGNKTMVYDSFGRRTYKILPSLFNKEKTTDTEYDAEQTINQTNCGARSLSWLILFDKWGSKLAKHI